jgi:hypothetical protein
MARNIGNFDRTLRVVAGLALLLWAVGGWPASAYSWLGWIGAVPLLTALIGFCPAYTLLGVSTCPLVQRKEG